MALNEALTGDRFMDGIKFCRYYNPIKNLHYTKQSKELGKSLVHPGYI